MSTCIYNLNDIYRIKRLGFSYMLPNEVIDNIRSFESSITPIDNKKKKNQSQSILWKIGRQSEVLSQQKR